MKEAARVLALLVVLLTLPRSLGAQDSTVITGRVLTQEGAPVQGVTVGIPDAQIGGVTDAQGRFVLVGVPSGQVVLNLALIGYASVSREVTVVPGQTNTVNVILTAEMAFPTVTWEATGAACDIIVDGDVVGSTELMKAVSPGSRRFVWVDQAGDTLCSIQVDLPDGVARCYRCDRSTGKVVPCVGGSEGRDRLSPA